MEVNVEKMSQPVMITVKEDAESFTKRKDKTYNIIKKTLPKIKGFRKGNAPRDIAEKNLDVEKLYKSLIDDIYLQIAKQYHIIGADNFNFFGNLKDDKSEFTMTFKAELKPDVKLPTIENLDLTYIEPSVTEEDVLAKIVVDLAKEDKIEDSDKDTLDNLDIAVIDFEGILDGEKKPFKGGTAKGYNVCVNEDKDGKKQFIDNFEDKMVGMKIGEERIVNVKFPDDYRDNTKAGKKVKFNVKLNKIKNKIKQELIEEFAIGRGHKSVEEYKKSMKQSMFETKKKDYENNLRRIAINAIKEKAKFTPIPESMVIDEINKNWSSYLARLGKTEEDLLKENKEAKLYFYDSNKDQAGETVKITMILEKIIEKYNITATKKEVEEHVLSLSSILSYDDERKEKVMKTMATNIQQFNLMKSMKLNEKAMDFVVDMFKK